MTQEIQPYPQAPGGGLAAPGQSDQPAGAVSFGRLVAMLRRRWLIILAVWLPLVGMAVPVIWMNKKPTYTASAHIKVEPFLKRVLFKDEDNQQMPLFDSYLRTQSELVSSNQVLTAALAEESVKGLPLQKEPDPLSELRRSLKTGTVPGTQIIQVSVTRENAAEARALAKVVTDAYLYWVENTEKREENAKRQLLESEQKRLRESVEASRKEKLRLADEFGAVSDTTFDLLMQSVAESTIQTRQNRETIELEILQIEDQIKQIEDGVYTGLLPDEALAREQERVENDPLVVSYRSQMLSESARLVQMVKAGFTEESKEVIKTREQIDLLKAELDKERVRAAENLEKDRVAAQSSMKDSILARKKQQLAATQRRRDELKKRVEEQDAYQRRIGQRGILIRSLQETIDRQNKDLEVVEERLKQLEIESQRPGRISKASEAEILPSGISDKRLKLSGAAAVGILFFAVAVAYIRDQADARVNTPDEVEAGMGLRLLGVVPPVKELTSGRVTEEDFAECYRLVRVNLLSSNAGAAPPKAILITSAQAGEGKTSLAVSLSASLAELGGKVLLIDGDIQYPRVGEVLSLDAPGSLKEVLTGERTLAECTVRSKLPGLEVLISRLNGDSARGVLDSNTAARLVREAAGQYDHIVIDSPPALGAADALVWAQAVDGVVLSTFAGQSSVKAAHVACQRLKMVGSKLLGAVICNLSMTSGSYSYSSSSARSARSADFSGRTHSGRQVAPPFVQLPVSGGKHHEADDDPAGS